VDVEAQDLAGIEAWASPQGRSAATAWLDEQQPTCITANHPRPLLPANEGSEDVPTFVEPDSGGL
jgi:hypothetical protein